MSLPHSTPAGSGGHGQGLPPYAAFRPTGELPRLRAEQLGLTASDLDAGLASLPFPADEPLCLACDPSPLDESQLVVVSPAAAGLIGLTPAAFRQPAWSALLSGEAVLEQTPSYATVYAGHQFGVFVPRLGDGRALNLGRVRGWELQLKGAGSTPYARHADGRAVLRSSVREFLCSEAMAALGVPTTRALSLVHSATPVFREQVEPGAVVCRMAPSFVRFGHFEYLTLRRRPELSWLLIDHLIEQQPLFQAASGLTDGRRLSAFFEAVMTATAQLMAHWTAEGFMHGVMNTDNFSILGLTIDYGPFGWMEGFEAQSVCNHSDDQGRYRFSHQPAIGLWNVERLLAALTAVAVWRLGQVAGSQWTEAWREDLMPRYEAAFQAHFQQLMAKKLGVAALPSMQGLIDGLYPLLQRQQIDYPRFMRGLAGLDLRQAPDQSPEAWASVLDECPDRDDGLAWLRQYRGLALAQAAPGVSPDQASQLPAKALADWQQARRAANPAFVLRNWVGEEIIRALEDEGDSGPIEKALRVFLSPYEDHPEAAHWRAAPPDWAKNLSLSCSS